jgi:hypothetical protein
MPLTLDLYLVQIANLVRMFSAMFLQMRCMGLVLEEVPQTHSNLEHFIASK